MKKNSQIPASQTKKQSVPKKITAKKVVKKETKQKVKADIVQIKQTTQNIPTPEIKEEQKVESISSPLQEFNLTSILNEIDKHFLSDKSSFILDTTEQLSVFLKYKGDIIDFPLFQLEEKMKRTTKEAFIEKVRLAFVRSLRCGQILGLLVGNSLIDFSNFFKDVEFFEMDKIFTPSQIKNKEFYKKNMLKPEEDVDAFGNKGYFQMNPNFRVCIIVHDTPNLEQMKSTLKLPYHLFNLCKIVQ